MHASAELRRWFPVPAMILAVLLLFAGAATRTEAESQKSRETVDQASDQSPIQLQAEEADSAPETKGPLSRVQERAVSGEYLVPDEAAHKQAKDEAAAKADKKPSSTEKQSATAQASKTTNSFEGIRDANHGPSDSRGRWDPPATLSWSTKSSPSTTAPPGLQVPTLSPLVPSRS